MNASRPNPQEREATLRRVAIVLNSLPAPLAGKLLSSFDQDKRSRLRKTMTGLADVDPLERKRALEFFSGSIHQHVQEPASQAFHSATGNLTAANDEFVAGSPDATPSANSTTVTAEDPWSGQLDRHPLGFLHRVPNPQIVDILTHEHPQTVAVVLASVPPDSAAKIIPGLPRQLRDDVIRRIGRMTQVEPDMLSDVADLLKAKCMDIDLPRDTQPGSHALRAIMAKMQVPHESPPQESGGGIESSVLRQTDVDDAMKENAVASHRGNSAGASSSESASPAHSRQTTPSLSTDDVNMHLQSLSPMELCIALGHVDAREALLTLCGLPMKHANRAIAMLPKPQQKKTREQLANLGPLQLAEIDRAKEKVAQASQAPTSAPIAA